MELIEKLKKENKVIPAISDTIFKRVMTEYKDYLGLILENVMSISSKEVKEDGIFLNNELPPNHLSLKNSRVDLILKVNNYLINLEANRKFSTSLIFRNEAHFSGIIFNEYAGKEKIGDSKKIYQINFNNYIYETNEIVLTFKYKDESNKIVDENYVKMHLNLEIVKNKYYNKEELNRFEKALLLLILEDIEKIKEVVKGDEILEEVAKGIMSYSEMKAIVDAYQNEIIEENYKNGLIREAREEAMKQGMEEGIEKGIEQNKIDTAVMMLKNKLDIEIISKCTGLSIDMISKLKLND